MSFVVLLLSVLTVGTLGQSADLRPRVTGVMELLGITRSDLEAIISRVRNSDKFEWNGEIKEIVKSKILPEFCDLTPDNCTAYSSHFLDCNCVRKFGQMKEECRDIKCDLVRYIINEGPRAVRDFLQSDTVVEAAKVVYGELKKIFQNYNFCKCGKDLFKASLSCVQFYDGNWLREQWTCGRFDDLKSQLRNADLQALSKIAGSFLRGMCEKSRKDRSVTCFDQVFEAVEQIAEMIRGTMDDYRDYERSSARDKRKYEERCDRMFGALKAWDSVDMDWDWSDVRSQDGLGRFFNKSSALMDNLYCKWPCKKERHELYPCCLKRLLADHTIYSLIRKFAVSIARLPGIHDQWWIKSPMWNRYSNHKDWLQSQPIPDFLIDGFKRTINAARHCNGRTLRCFE